MIAQVPITVSLPISTVVVPQDGTQVIVPIDITSTSETALVAVSGLAQRPSREIRGIGHKPLRIARVYRQYWTPAGTYRPTVTVNSAGQTASTNFTLVVTE